ncbi:uncharacterized protein LOC135384871 [Ornithodoros turicata]|uniref:uncharacterized protein LOC135384871 n=1 Tax=Ornithodoros turicata TaxID=34597 RepID=UPI0031386FDC
MVERLHHRIKTALKSVSPASWTDALPLILLSLRATVKEDLQCSPAQMVYGTTLRLRGDFFAHPSPIVHTDPTTYPERLRTVMQALPAVRPRSPAQPSTYRHPLLETASHVLIRHDAPRKPLQPTYDGPYKVLQRSPKHFTLQLAGRQDTVSVDRLKPAFIESPVDVSPATTPPSLPPHQFLPEDTTQPVRRRRVHWTRPLSTTHH